MPPPPADDIDALRRENRELRQQLERVATASREVSGTNNLEIQLLRQRVDRIEGDLASSVAKLSEISQRLAITETQSRDRAIVETTNTSTTWQFAGVALAAMLSLVGSIISVMMK